MTNLSATLDGPSCVKCVACPSVSLWPYCSRLVANAGAWDVLFEFGLTRIEPEDETERVQKSFVRDEGARRVPFVLGPRPLSSKLLVQDECAHRGPYYYYSFLMERSRPSRTKCC